MNTQSYYSNDSNDNTLLSEFGEAVTVVAEGLGNTWSCTSTIALTDTEVEAIESFTCARFLPKVSESDADDLRFDMDLSSGTLGWATSATIAWVAPAADNYTWAGAAQVATAAGAVLLATLAF